MADPVQLLSSRLDALRAGLAAHFSRHKWSYIFACFAWALVWYGVMDVLTLLMPSPRFPPDLMPIIAGVPIIIVGWRAVKLGDRLRLAVEDFDDGAAFVFPAGKSGVKRAFLDDLRKTISWYSKLVSATIFAISLAGVIFLTLRTDLDPDYSFIAVLLVVGVPLIAIPIGALLGQLVGYAQFGRMMDRNGIALAGLSTPQARSALRGLENVHAFAVVALSVLCFWFAGWWIGWMFDYGPGYERMWRTQFLILWVVSIALFIAAGAWPAWSFRRRVAELTGGVEGRKAVDAQILQAEADLARWEDPASEKSRRQRERIAELKRFIANLKDQRIDSWLLDPRFHALLMILNLLILLLPSLIPAAPPPPAKG